MTQRRCCVDPDAKLPVRGSQRYSYACLPDACRCVHGPPFLLSQAFLVDGSDSIDPADFLLAKDFVKTVASRFTLGKDKQQVAMVTYSGWFASEKPGATKNSVNNQCDQGMFCEYNAGSQTACGTCAFPNHFKCPKGSSYLGVNKRNEQEYCHCRNSCTERTGWEKTPNAKCLDSSPGGKGQYDGCFQQPIRFTTNKQATGQCYEDVPQGILHDVFPLACKTCRCDGISVGGEPVTPVIRFDQADSIAVCSRAERCSLLGCTPASECRRAAFVWPWLWLQALQCADRWWRMCPGLFTWCGNCPQGCEHGRGQVSPPTRQNVDRRRYGIHARLYLPGEVRLQAQRPGRAASPCGDHGREFKHWPLAKNSRRGAQIAVQTALGCREKAGRCDVRRWCRRGMHRNGHRRYQPRQQELRRPGHHYKRTPDPGRRQLADLQAQIVPGARHICCYP